MKQNFRVSASTLIYSEGNDGGVGGGGGGVGGSGGCGGVGCGGGRVMVVA